MLSPFTTDDDDDDIFFVFFILSSRRFFALAFKSLVDKTTLRIK